MKFSLPMCIFLIIGCSKAFSQKIKSITYAGFDVGLKLQKFVSTSSNDVLELPVFLYVPLYGLTIEHELKSRNILIGSGLYWNSAGAAFRFKGDVINIYRGQTAVQIPLRLQLKIPISFGIPEVQLGVTLGAHLAINTNFGRVETYNSFVATSPTATYRVTSRNDWQRAYGLAELGVFTNIILGNGSFFVLGVEQVVGFSKVVSLNLRYKTSATSPIFSDEIASRGGYFNLKIGYQYPVSRFWKKSHKT